MVHATERKPRRNEKPLLPQPEPSMTVVNTHVGLCLFGVRMRSAMQIAIDAMTAWLLESFPYGYSNRLTVDRRKP
jgi:hypothetical protein